MKMVLLGSSTSDSRGYWVHALWTNGITSYDILSLNYCCSHNHHHRHHYHHSHDEHHRHGSGSSVIFYYERSRFFSKCDRADDSNDDSGNVYVGTLK